MASERAFAPDPGSTVVCFALRREAAPFLRICRPLKRATGAPCEVLFAPSLAVLITGVGAARTTAALDWLFQQSAPSLVIAAGFAGSLSPRFTVGSAVDCSEVLDSTLNSWQVPVRASNLPTARLITVPRLIADPAEKLTLAEMSDATAVDMESAAVARFCHDRRVPFACVRAISDCCDTALSPRLVGLLAGGRVSPWRLATTLLRSPGLIGGLIRLGRDTKRAARNLALAVQAILARSGARATAPAPHMQ
jgi:hypothetical protein